MVQSKDRVVQSKDPVVQSKDLVVHEKKCLSTGIWEEVRGKVLLLSLVKRRVRRARRCAVLRLRVLQSPIRDLNQAIHQVLPEYLRSQTEGWNSPVSHPSLRKFELSCHVMSCLVLSCGCF